ncbi:MAG: helix-turn-helix domain-containing protein [Candidatus Edwardsbacteria bacterium]|nr:helix-turn-helix domain-containing protein [Candidatus Edwardsbacteria bacterium]
MDALIRLLGNKVRMLRKAQGLSQEKLGEKAGFDYRYIGFIEQARVNPTIKTLEKVAHALKLTVPDLFPSSKEIETNKKGVPAKVVEREKIMSKIMKDLNKVDNRKLKSIAKIVNISASGEGVS